MKDRTPFAAPRAPLSLADQASQSTAPSAFGRRRRSALDTCPATPEALSAYRRCPTPGQESASAFRSASPKRIDSSPLLPGLTQAPDTHLPPRKAVDLFSAF